MKISNAIYYYKQYGFLAFIKRAFTSVRFEFFERTVIFLMLDMNDLKGDVQEPYSFHESTIFDIQQAQDFDENWFTRQETLQRLRDGHRLFVFKINDKIVYYTWGDVKNITIYYLDMNFIIPANMVYINGVYTMPAYRGKGIGKKLGKEIFHYLKKEGIKYLIAVVDPANTTALKIDKEIGFKEYQTINYKRYGYIRRYIVQKFNSGDRKTFITIFKSPKNIGKHFVEFKQPHQ